MADFVPGNHSHSGKLGAALSVVPIGGLLASLILSIAYAYVTVYSPIAGYISLLFVFGLAFGLGWSIAKLGYLTRCRNTSFLHLVGLVCGLVAVYVSFAAFEYALLSRYDEDFNASLVDVLFSPAAVWKIATLINVDGWYSIFGYTPTGVVLWLLWGIEAALVVGGSALFATMAIAEEVFCEDCNQWCSRTPDVLRLDLSGEENNLDELRPDNLIPLVTLGPADTSASNFLRVDMWKCDSCDDTAAIQSKICSIVIDDEGKPEEKTVDLTPVWLVPSTALSELRKLAVG